MYRGLIVTLLALLLTQPAAAQDTLTLVMEHDGRARTYLLRVPSTYTGTEPVPLVIALHPAGGGAAGMARITGFDALAERDGVIVMYPEGPFGYWDYGAGLPEWDAIDTLDDPGFVAAALDDVAASYSIDPARVYVVGYSNGGRMAYRLACDLGGRLAGVAVVAATISDEVTAACPPESRVPLLFLHGTADPVIPWNGKTLYIDDTPIARALSAPDTATFWAAHNGCDADPLREQGRDRAGRVLLRRVTYSGCEDDARVVFYGVEGGGHGWILTSNLDTSALIRQFFLPPQPAG